MYNTNFENFIILDVNLQKAAIENSRKNWKYCFISLIFIEKFINLDMYYVVNM